MSQSKIGGDLLIRCTRVQLARDRLGGDARDGRPAKANQRTDSDWRRRIIVWAPRAGLIAIPVNASKELLARRRQHRLAVCDCDQAEVRVEVAPALQVD